MVVQFDCFAGVTETAITGAWLALGADVAQLCQVVARFASDDICRVEVRRGGVNGIQATQVDVDVLGAEERLSLAHARTMVGNSALPAPVVEKIDATLQALDTARQQVHGALQEEDAWVHAINMGTLVRIVTAISGWYLIGQPTCQVSEVVVGTGVDLTADGPIIYPSAVTIELLTGFVTRSLAGSGALVSEPGAAILRSLCRQGPVASLVTEKVGYSTDRRATQVPDIMRAQLGQAVSPSETSESRASVPGQFIVETNIDDMNPEWAGFIVPRLLEVGASDAYLMPIIMKKGRPGIQLRVLCRGDRLEVVKHEIFRQTSSIGLRYYEIQKEALSRRFEKVDTPYGEVTVKIAYRGDAVLNVAPEYEDCRALAQAHDIPLKLVYQAALRQIEMQSQG
ncbi:UPF0272 protein [Alicyclobacillus acidoterrestris]|uniref:LarC family nickel insertion protein n=1 Tax=Alicyclobacillus suci TaxID=2816080 RepID=UPI00119558A2|nr:LarC family nickel insertion protein [Alicyclobacillus suci]GEO27682.1 UPF0272 protein [Alicyclobacillus acidoterrestris]